MTELFNQGYALLIGVGECAYERLSLPVTVKDTQAIYAALIDPELCAYPNDREHIRVLNNQEATRSRILDGLKWLKEKAEIEPEATIFVYYSGHGWLNRDDNSFYLIQHDVKPAKLAATALSGRAFTEALREIQAERLLVVIDSCHAAGMATSKEPEEADAELLDEFDNFQRVAPSKGLFFALTQGKGRVVFTSSEGEQKSWIKKDNSMSIYTFHFLEALQGAANKPGDSEVKVSNLMNHLGKTVPETARNLYSAEQTPHFDFYTVDFAIAKLRGGKGLPDRGSDEVKSEAQEKNGKIAEVVIKNVGGKNLFGSIGDNNQVTNNIYPFRNNEAKRSLAEQKLLKRVKIRIEEYLDELPEKVNLINLDKEWQQEKVKHPNGLVLNSRYQGTIGENKNIFDIFQLKDAHKRLLILGEPGAGKTTTMLELAKASLDLTEQKNDSPIPVFLKLSSWKKDGRTMFAWLVDQIEEYGSGISKEDVKELLIGDKLLLILDGLDELEESSRKNCVEAINNLLKPDELVHENQGSRKNCVEAINNLLKSGELVHENQCRWFPDYIVISSRRQEYETLELKLQLRRAICLRALSDAQIQEYLRDRKSENFWQTLQDQDRNKLRDVLQRPLFLRIVCDAMQEISINKLTNFTSLEERQLYLSISYIRWCLLKESKDSEREKNIRLLIWLAQQLQNHGQTEFFIERMQPSWLPPGTLKWYVLLVLLSIFLIFLLLLMGGIYIDYNIDSNFNSLNIVRYRIFIIGSLVTAVSASLHQKINVFEEKIVNAIFCKHNINSSNFRQTLVFVILFAVGLLIFLSLSTIPHYVFKLICIICCGLLMVGIARLNGHELQQKTRPNQGIWNSARNAGCVAIPIAIAIPIVITVATGLSLKFPFKLFILQFLSSLLMIGLPAGLICALLYGGLTCIQHFILRLILLCHGHPWNYVKFLDNAVKLKLLRQVGGRYEFIHSLLKECFAILPDMY